MEQLFLIFISDLCYQQLHQTSNIIFFFFFFVSYEEQLFSFSLSLFPLFLHINSVLIWWRLVMKINEFKKLQMTHHSYEI
ncbi:hypothetical protein ERO13_D02G069801v2 [Gossypium hirsutum]|uniref:Uncharacterized protein n=1 Tax=Gossypium barbadense TaxID=3634 RepID=A0A5J5SEN4_GOSBA|nr:hypothetical protein ES319_D02G081000v1 [Gossypium barbadense]KAG4157565.1 hypothetical protein ERO13_D02G069801v2 [Gossypium hirsutum]